MPVQWLSMPSARTPGMLCASWPPVPPRWRRRRAGACWRCFAAVPDPRDPRGKRHPLPAVLALCLAAVLSRNTELEDVTAWVHAAPQEVLAAAGARAGRTRARGVTAPHPDDRGPGAVRARARRAVADHAGAYLACRAHPGPVALPLAGPGWLPAIAVDGKAVRGAAGGTASYPYLLAAAVHSTGTVLAERLIGPKTNEVPGLAPLLRELNGYYCLAGHVITADAGHTVRAHATFICEELRRTNAFTVKQNTPALWDEIDALRLEVRGAARHRGERPRPPRAAHHPGHGRPRAHARSGSRTPGDQVRGWHRAVRHPRASAWRKGKR